MPIPVNFGDSYSISTLRAGQWVDVPTGPGAYRWYFPVESLGLLGIAEHCNLKHLNLHKNRDGMLGLYLGVASSLRQRVKWHCAQRLSQSVLRSGFLSTYRFSLLALAGINYLTGEESINEFMDTLKISWVKTNSKEEAGLIEDAELIGTYHYPINIKGNHKPELAHFKNHLTELRRSYKALYIKHETS